MHDPGQQISYIRQGLSLDKRPLALFIGAGCPTSVREDGEPLIPDIRGITSKICLNLTGDQCWCELIENLRSVLEEDDIKDPTVEDMLNMLRGLSAIAGAQTVRGFSREQLTRLDKEICNKISELVNKPLPTWETGYSKLAHWVQAIKRTAPVHIFTTNYDVLLEEALEEAKVPFFDGFVGSRQAFFDIEAIEHDQLPVRWARVWKLHGSINWSQDDQEQVWRGKYEDPLERPMIHPSHLKYYQSRRMPYLVMMDQLKSFLREPYAILIACGYSFQDEHLNDVIVGGLRGNSTCMVFGLQYDKLSSYAHATELARRHPNFSVLARDGGVIGRREADWIERAEADLLEGSPGIGWRGGEDGHDVRRPEFMLGDFAVFGEFLEELTGPRQDL